MKYPSSTHWEITDSADASEDIEFELIFHNENLLDSDGFPDDYYLTIYQNPKNIPPKDFIQDIWFTDTLQSTKDINGLVFVRWESKRDLRIGYFLTKSGNFYSIEWVNFLGKKDEVFERFEAFFSTFKFIK